MFFNFEKKFDIDKDKLNKPIVLIGWPGIAYVAKLAISSIKDSIEANLFSSIKYFDFPAKSTVENGSLEIPSAEVYYKPRKKNDIFILTANFQPQSSEGVFEFSKKFCEVMDEITNGKIVMYVSTGALATREIDGEPKVHISSTDEELLDSFLKFENITTMDKGIIAGANGILPAWAGKMGFAPGACLLAETVPIPVMEVDPKASKALVTIIRDYFEIDIDFSELDKKIEEMQSMFESFKQQAEHFMKGGKDEGGPDSYFR
ncbi:MAG: hypothetical protein GF353_19605 [Candidatus Lokiarchaeota archaeon]|nr:hypothetical protein [Candidatus Lokiarchaeota archaeon]